MHVKRNLLSVLMVIVLITGLLPVPRAAARSLDAPDACPCSIWPGPVTPGFTYDNPNPIEMGLKFRSDVPGQVTGARFYKAVGATGTHIGRLWSMAGVKLAEVTFSGETASGWQTASFPTPVSILANTTYIISYYVADGNRRFSDTFDYFATAGVDYAPLHALAAGVDGPNAVFSDTGGWFNQTYRSSNYWVDLVFMDVADTTPPTVSSVLPAAGSSGIIVSANASAVFSEAMDPATITSSTFELRDPLNNLVSAAVSYTAGTLTALLNPDANLSFSTTYTATIKGGSSGVKDFAGNPLAVDYTWSFTTEAADTTPPTVASISPLNGAVEVPLAANVSAVFSEALDSATVTAANFELRDPLNSLVSAAISYDAGTMTALLNPDANLSLGTVYTARLRSGSTGVKDLAGNPLAADYVWSFTNLTPLTVTSVKPINGVTRLRLATSATAYFNRALNPATLTTSTFEMRDGANTLVPATVTYNAGDNSAVLDPISNLNYASTYTLRLVSGSGGVTDASGIPLAADYTWSFSTEVQRPAVDQSPGGPILVISSSANLFTRYFTEILRAEGLNEFALSDLSAVTAETLAGYDIVILGDMALTVDQVSLLTTWVNGGGHLIAMRPDKQLAGLLGLTDAATTLSNGYLLIDTAQSPGSGIVGQTLQFHGTADAYTLNGAASLATLYSTRDTVTSYPAVTLRSVGTSGGLAAAFTFDLARSIVYTHQGNPAWQIGHVNPLQSYGTALDLFYDAITHWVDFSRIGIPQADEQQRFLANLILFMNTDTKPLPRFWYFPNGKKAAIILTGDDHNGRASPSGSSQVFFDRHISQSTPGCSAEDWECVRSSSYGYGGALLTDAQAAAYAAMGFEFGVHGDAGLASGGGWCGTWPVDMPAKYAEQFEAVYRKYVSIPVQASERSHCYSWFGYTGAAGWNGYAGQPEVEANLGIRMDTNISYNPSSWASVNPGYQMGTGMLMRFAQVDISGNMTAFLDIFNAGTRMTDDNGQGAATMRSIVDSYLDAALGSQGYYGAFVVNMHSDNWYGWSYDGSDQIVASAKAHNVPVVSGRQMTDWLDGRNSSSFSGLTWDGTTLGFTVVVGSGARNLQGMLPASFGSVPLDHITRDGNPVAFTTETIKGVQYAFFPTTAGVYAAVYVPDTTAPVISAVSAVPTGGETATVTWTTDEPATSRVEYGTDPLNLALNVTEGALVTAHTINLTGLSPNTVYYFRVRSADGSGNTAYSPAIGNPPGTFTTPSASLIDTTVADFSAGTPDGNIYISQMANGEVILNPAVKEEFSGGPSLPTGWIQTNSGGSVSVNNGLLTVDGANVGTSGYYPAGRSMEAVATFGGAANQHLGFGVNLTGGSGDAWAIISTSASGSGLFARSWNGSGAYSTETKTTISGSFFGAPHLYRIDWKTDSIEYYVDGAPVATHTLAISTQMRPMVSDSTVGGATVAADWIHVSPYPVSGTFHSRIFDTLGTVTSGAITWTADTPAGTSLAMSIRSGNSITPDGGWTDFSAVTNGAPIGSGFRYLQYRAELATSNVSLSLVLREVMIMFNRSDDTFPPTVTGRSPAPGAIEVPLNADITVQFSEPMNSSSITTGTFRLRLSGGTTDWPATVSYSGLTATLHPTTPLDLQTTYEVTLSGTVSDASNNPLGADDAWTFTTVTVATMSDNTAAEFGAGALGMQTYLSLSGNGEVILKPAAGSEFSGTGVPEGWQSTAFSAGGTTTFSNGLAVIDGAKLGTSALFSPRVTLEGVVTFNAVRFQHFGFAVTYMVDGTPWMIISTGPNGDGLYARTYTGIGSWDTQSTPIAGSYFGTPHLYKVDWFADHIDYYVDGSLVATHNIAIAVQTRPLIADSDVGGPSLSVDWARLGPYESSGAFTSRVFDAGRVVYWTELLASATTPTGTSLSFETRSSLNNLDWSEWQSANSPIISPAGRYLQYRATLGTTNTSITPSLERVDLDYTLSPTAVSLSLFDGKPRQNTIQLDWETASEVELLGFNLYRSNTLDGPRQKQNARLIQARKPGQLVGAGYQFSDPVSPGKRYYYWLEWVGVDGAEVAGPVTINSDFLIHLPVIVR